MDTEDGGVFIKHLAHFVRTHEKALANALQLQRKHTKNASSTSSITSPTGVSGQQPPPSSTNAIAAALSLPYLTFGSQSVKPVKLTLTPHHLFYLLSRFEELSISVGPMNVRLEHINTGVLPGNYVSFLGSVPKSRRVRSDADSIHSVSSVRSAFTTMTSMWTRLGLASKEESKIERQKAVEKDDLKYLYSAFTKIPCLRLAPDHRSRLIAGYEEFPFDTAVPLFAFKNLSALEICDLDFRQMYGWDRLAEQLRSLTIKRGSVDDVTDLLVHIVLDDMDKRRRRSSKNAAPSSPATPWPAPGPHVGQIDPTAPMATPGSPLNDNRRSSIGSPQAVAMARKESTDGKRPSRYHRQRSQSPVRPTSRHAQSYIYPRSATPKYRRSSGSDSSSVHSTPRNSFSNLLSLNTLQPNKWRFLKHLSLADNGMTFILAAGLAPLATTLHSLDLSSNLFTEIPDSLATLTNLRALNLSNCMISSLHSLGRNPLPAITVINLHSNRLSSLAGIERLFSLERIDLRDNRLTDPTELARLTRIPDMQHVYVQRNPFTRTHSNYRTTIFNLFRSSAGYTEDVYIDSAGPTSGERKHLIDRATEEQNVPIVRKPNDSSMPPPAIPQKNMASIAADRQSEAAAYDAAQRRKAPRRRIVELSQSNPSSPETRRVDTPHAEAPSPTKTAIESRLVVSATRSRQDIPLLPPIETQALTSSPSYGTPDLVEDSDSPVQASDEINMASDVYRQKIEALKNDLGNGWLTALNEDKWDQKRSIPRGHGSNYSSVHSGRAGAPGVSAGNGVTVSTRTLG